MQASLLLLLQSIRLSAMKGQTVAYYSQFLSVVVFSFSIRGLTTHAFPL